MTSEALTVYSVYLMRPPVPVEKDTRSLVEIIISESECEWRDIPCRLYILSGCMIMREVVSLLKINHRGEESLDEYSQG